MQWGIFLSCFCLFRNQIQNGFLIYGFFYIQHLPCLSFRRDREKNEEDENYPTGTLSYLPYTLIVSTIEIFLSLFSFFIMFLGESAFGVFTEMQIALKRWLKQRIPIQTTSICSMLPSSGNFFALRAPEL